ncbi:hypothetical protein TNCV_2589861 [Trichonephila clavipes]|nr:hypothetical protein TNCV_2589861 [Trichonephila clavipes]
MGQCSETSRDAIGSDHALVPSCAGENKGSYKKRCPNDAAVRIRTGWLSRCKIRRLRRSEVLSDFWQWKAVRVWVMTRGQANTVITSDLIDKVDDLVRSDRHVILRMLVLKVDVSYGTVWTIVHDNL